MAVTIPFCFSRRMLQQPSTTWYGACSRTTRRRSPRGWQSPGQLSVDVSWAMLPAWALPATGRAPCCSGSGPAPLCPSLLHLCLRSRCRSQAVGPSLRCSEAGRESKRFSSGLCRDLWALVSFYLVVGFVLLLSSAE